jgi:hypothetical protein
MAQRMETQRTGYDPNREPDKRRTGLGILIAVLVAGAIAVLLFFALGGDADVDTEGGDIDVEAPETDVDVDAPDIDAEAPDVELPEVDIEGGDVDPGDVDVQEGDAEADAGP